MDGIDALDGAGAVGNRKSVFTEVQWITSEVFTMHHWIQVDPYSSSEFETVSSALHPNMDPTRQPY